MTIWICKGPFAAVALMLLAACDGGQPALLLQRAMDVMPDLPALQQRSVVPLTQAAMAQGAVVLVPPKGYCIDGATLTPRFAIMARCDVLGAANASSDAPLGLLTVSMSPATTSALPTVQAISGAAKLAQISAVQQSDYSVTFQASGPPPDQGYGARHWHGATVAGGYALGLSLYGAKDSRALGEDGRDLLIGLIRRTQAKTP